MSSEFKQKSISLRIKGYSVREISNMLSVSKGSVSTWVRNVVLTSEQKLYLKEKIHSPEVVERRRQSRLQNETKKKELFMSEISKEISKIDKEMLKMIGIAIYWGEGAKTMKGMARIRNSDPVLIKGMMRFFREVCNISGDRFHAHIHIHSRNATREAEDYWSIITGIPLSQFYKTYSIKSKSSKNIRNSLKYGTVDVGVCDTKMLLRILGWLEGMKKQLI